MHALSAPPSVILVVEDEALIRFMAVDVLEQAGFVTFDACDAAEALRQFARHPEIDLLFTDINMPGDVDGLDLAHIVCGARPDVRLILTSGREHPGVSRIPSQGLFLQKPYRLDSLLELIGAA